MGYPQIVETLGSAMDVAGVVLIIGGLLIASCRYLLNFRTPGGGYTRYRQDIGRAILLVLEVLVVGDIIKKVVARPTPIGVAVLAGIVMFLTFLIFSLQFELDRRFPWQRPV